MLDSLLGLAHGGIWLVESGGRFRWGRFEVVSFALVVEKQCRI